MGNKPSARLCDASAKLSNILNTRETSWVVGVLKAHFKEDLNLLYNGNPPQKFYEEMLRRAESAISDDRIIKKNIEDLKEAWLKSNLGVATINGLHHDAFPLPPEHSLVRSFDRDGKVYYFWPKTPPQKPQ